MPACAPPRGSGTEGSSFCVLKRGGEGACSQADLHPHSRPQRSLSLLEAPILSLR